MAEIKCVGILTSGGDAPGMNAAIRAVTRTAIYNGFEVKGIMRGYRGLITNEILPFKTQNVSNIIQQGGTILKTARCMEFKTPEGRKLAYENMQAHGIDALVVIGGDGSLTGARVFASEYNFPIVGLPGTIDNDLFGSIETKAVSPKADRQEPEVAGSPAQSAASQFPVSRTGASVQRIVLFYDDQTFESFEPTKR